jgi:DNA invertase Pin-like site-specific DNA recombinase
MQSILDALATYTRSLAERQIRQAFEQSQKEVDDLRERTREGLRETKAKGRVLGTHAGSTRMTAKEKNAT